MVDDKSIIAAVEYKNIHKAVQSNAFAVWLMYANINDLLDEKWNVYSNMKPIFIHLDLIKGLSNDKESVKFVAERIKPAGIVTTKSNIIRSAKKHNLITIQRIFLIDTKSLETAIENIAQNDPHAVEIMPGIAPEIIKEIAPLIKCPIIVGGLIKTENDVNKAFNHGAAAVSLSTEYLWNYCYK